MITEHFEKRCKERYGLKKKLSSKLFNKILEEGIWLDECKSRPRFYSYLVDMCKCSRTPIIFNKYIVIVQQKKDSNEYVAITILNLPKEYYSTVNSLYKEKRSKINGENTGN